VAEQQSPSAPRPKEVSPELAPPVENAPERAPRTERERVEPKQPEPKQPEPKQADGLFRLTVPDELPQRQAPAKPRPSPQQQARPKPDEARPRPEKQASAAEQTAGPTYSARAFQGGGAAGVARPPGYTRSGENDDFARRVVAALRQTMPQMNVRGRVTVRLVLNEHGNLAEVKMLANSGDASLAPAVVFSTRQASFPLPPARSLEIDRIFLITYSYH
jgi:outer membrane biosynthesis protein TonB